MIREIFINELDDDRRMKMREKKRKKWTKDIIKMQKEGLSAEEMLQGTSNSDRAEMERDFNLRPLRLDIREVFQYLLDIINGEKEMPQYVN